MADWVRAEIGFAAMYSYRVPNLSPSFAICSPLPSPASIRLALVDAVIRHTGSIARGQEMFELVKTAGLELQPPSRVAVMKFFMRRLKPEKPEKGRRPSIIQSTGIREYCLPSDPMVVWMESKETEPIEQAFSWLRRIGTTDSLASCTVSRGDPDLRYCMKEANTLPVDPANFAKRAVFTLHELNPDAKFDQINPYSQSRRGQPFIRRLYVLPLVRERSAQNWTLYRREAFNGRSS